MGKGANAYQTTKYTGISVQTSAQGVVIPYVAGQTRCGTNLIWYGDFVATPVKQGKGGKGGGKGSQLYTYTAAVVLALCEGPIQSVGQVWTDQTVTTLAKLGLTLFTGTSGQTPWAYLVSKHPTQALSYALTAYLANEAYALGEAPTLPNHNFELISKFVGTMPGTVDVNLGDVIPDYLNNVQYSLGPFNIDSTSLSFFKTYQQAQGLFFSPNLDQAEQISQTVDRWASLGNTWIFYCGDSIKFVPLGDAAITANGVTYTPDTTIQFDLTEDDFVQDGSAPPVQWERKDPADCPNRVKLQVKDRLNAYNAASVEWQDQGLVDQFGRVDNPVSDASKEICDLTVANTVAQLVGRQDAYIRNIANFKLGYELGSGLDPGDLCTVTSPKSGTPKPRTVRIVQSDEDSHGNWTIQAQQVVQGTGTATIGTPPSSDGGFVDTDVDPGDTNAPIIIEPTPSLVNTPQLWLAASGGANWGSAAVFVSFDNVDFTPIGFISAPAWQGTLRSSFPTGSSPDVINTLAVDLSTSAGVMNTGATHADANHLRTLCVVAPNVPGSFAIPTTGELVAYGSVVNGSGGSHNFDLTYVLRGAYGTAIQNHANGSFFSRFDISSINGAGNSVLSYHLPKDYIGATIYFKLASINKFGTVTQNISTLSAYSYTPVGRGFGSGGAGLPAQASTLSGTVDASSVSLSWTANISDDVVQMYQIWGAPGSGTIFGSTLLLWSGDALNVKISNLSSGSPYTFYLVAVNTVGSATPSSSYVATTTTIIPSGGYREVTVSSSPFTLSNTDNVVGINNTTGAALEIRMMPSPTPGQTVEIFDLTGNAAAHNITLKDNGGVGTIDKLVVNGQGSDEWRWTSTSVWRQA